MVYFFYNTHHSCHPTTFNFLDVGVPVIVQWVHRRDLRLNPSLCVIVGVTYHKRWCVCVIYIVGVLESIIISHYSLIL